MNKRILAAVFLISNSFLLPACKSRSFESSESDEKGLADGMIYQPSREITSTPKDFDLSFQGFFIDSGENGKLHTRRNQSVLIIFPTFVV